MKLSVWSSYYYVLSPEDMLLEFKKHGFKYCELSSEHSEMLLERGDAKSVGEEFGKKARENGIEFSQGHLFFWDKRICKDEDRELIKRQIDLFLAIGIKNAVLHCDALKDENGVSPSDDIVRQENIKAIGDILDYVKGTDLVICLENLISCNATNNVNGLMYFIDYFNIIIYNNVMKNSVKFFVKIMSAIVCLFITANFFSACSQNKSEDTSGSISATFDLLKQFSKSILESGLNIEKGADGNLTDDSIQRINSMIKTLLDMVRNDGGVKQTLYFARVFCVLCWGWSVVQERCVAGLAR